jgi:hypothetical protein
VSAANSSRFPHFLCLLDLVLKAERKGMATRRQQFGNVTATFEIVTPTRTRAHSSDCVSRQGRLTAWPKRHGSRTGRNATRHESRGRRTLPAPTAAPPSPCQRARPGRWCHHRDAVPELRERIGSDPRPLPRRGESTWPGPRAAEPGGILRTPHDRSGSAERDSTGVGRVPCAAPPPPAERTTSIGP